MGNPGKKASSFLDEVTLWVEGGRGGDGCVHFRREAYVPRGGPDGGDGGRGGDVILRCNPQLRSLERIPRTPIRGAPGGRGGGNRCHGKDGEPFVLEVPEGTLVFDADSGVLLKDLRRPGEEFCVARGGRGGKGNARFATPTEQAPRIATPGEPGERRRIRLELRLLAHGGFVGFPNAGKSSLLRALTAAKPKVGDYPFTTLAPVLGVLEDEYGEQLILADLPGIIEGASRGVGLGEQFLRHMHRAGFLLEVLDGSLPSKELVTRHRILLEELARAPVTIPPVRALLLNKSDLLTPASLSRKRVALERATGLPVLPVSARTGAGLEELKTLLFTLFRAAREPSPSPSFQVPSHALGS